MCIRDSLNVVKTSARQDEISLDEEVIMTVNDFNIQQNMITSAEEALDLSIPVSYTHLVPVRRKRVLLKKEWKPCCPTRKKRCLS